MTLSRIEIAELRSQGRASRWHTRDVTWDGLGRVSDHTRAAIAQCAGCYAIYADGALMYVGMAERISSRVASHFTDRIQRRCSSILGRQPARYTVKFRPERFYGERATLEMRLIRRLQPPANLRGAA